MTLVSMEPDSSPYCDSSRASTLELCPDMARVTVRGQCGWVIGVPGVSAMGVGFGCIMCK